MVYQIVYIGASWCNTCKTIKPATEILAKKYNVALKCLDYDEDLSDDEKDIISKVPTLRIYNDERKIAEWNMNQVACLTDWLSKNTVLTSGDADF